VKHVKSPFLLPKSQLLLVESPCLPMKSPNFDAFWLANHMSSVQNPKNGIPKMDSGGVTPYHHQTTGVDCSQRSFQQLKSPRFSRSMTISPAPDTRGHTGPCPAARCDPLAPASRRRSRPICRCPAATHGTLCARRRLGSCRGIWSFGWSFYLPIGSMVLVYLLTFGVYWYILMVNVTIYSIHGSYGLR